MRPTNTPTGSSVFGTPKTTKPATPKTKTPLLKTIQLVVSWIREPPHPVPSTRKLVAPAAPLEVAYAALADALQCHWPGGAEGARESGGRGSDTFFCCCSDFYPWKNPPPPMNMDQAYQQKVGWFVHGRWESGMSDKKVSRRGSLAHLYLLETWSLRHLWAVRVNGCFLRFVST